MTCVNYLPSGKVYCKTYLQDGAILMADDAKQALEDVTGDDIRRVRECEEAARERLELEKRRAAETIEEARRRARAIEASADQRISRYQESCERKLERRMRELREEAGEPLRVSLPSADDPLSGRIVETLARRLLGIDETPQ